MKKTFQAIFLLILLIASGIQSSAASWGEKQTYTADDNSYYKFSMVVESPLKWAENVRSTVKVNVTLDTTPDNVSGLRVLYIQFILQGSVNGVSATPVGSKFLTVNDELRILDKPVQYNASISTPSIVNQFELNVTLAAIVTGNDTTQDISNPRFYRYIFPETLSKESKQVQVFVDLYGFPPASFLLRWAIILLPITLIFISPNLLLISGIRKRREKKSEENEKGEETAGGEAQ